ncbi:MAG: class I SAM-dependent methyltransferase [Gammaproteobacteria bacterium]|nr:class I SAM-dependent methyltransferase [Gammaproteobacteria bacterium]MDH5388231.1 class I SAM-dependent methyltransferase [Gammaproteobacteria bacterium]
MHNKPYADSCDQNRDSILNIIQPLLLNSSSVLEIGSGTGQHAAYFSKKLPHLIWNTSDRAENIEGIKLWLSETDTKQTPQPVELDVTQEVWPRISFDTVFTANTCHIMNQQSVEIMFKRIGDLLPGMGQLIIYGPFNYNQKYTSLSNEQFDQWLKLRNPESRIRNFEDLNAMAEQAGMNLINDYEMPANNRILHWKKMK